MPSESFALKLRTDRVPISGQLDLSPFLSVQKVVRILNLGAPEVVMLGPPSASRSKTFLSSPRRYHAEAIGLWMRNAMDRYPRCVSPFQDVSAKYLGHLAETHAGGYPFPPCGCVAYRLAV